MKQLLRRLSVLVLALSLLLTSVPAAHAARMETDGRDIRYGTIQVLGANQFYPTSYDAARDDENGLVYINADDFASIAGASLRKSGKYEDWYYSYTRGGWNLRICTERGIGQLSYDFDPETGDDVGYALYDDFQMTDCLYDPLTESWYFPFEEMLYMMALQWKCEKGVVIIYQAETLLDVMAEYETMEVFLPTYSQLMGEDGWERWNNAWNYGWTATIDELDMNFLWEGVESAWASAWGKPFFTDYEKNTLQSALLLMQSDLPAEGGDAVSSGMNWVSDFIGAACTVLDLSGDGGLEVAQALLSDMLSINASMEQLQSVSGAISMGAPLLGYALSVGQTQWIRDNVSDDLDGRLAFIQAAAEERAGNDPFWELAAEIAGDTRSKYCSEVSEAYEGIPLDSLMTTADAILSNTLGGSWKQGLTPPTAEVLKELYPDIDDILLGKLSQTPAACLSILNWMNLGVGTLDLCVEVAKKGSPTFASALELGENAHLCRYLVHICKLMREESSDALYTLQHGSSMNQAMLDEVRTGTHLMLVSSTHAHELLVKLGKYTAHSSHLETEFLLRLIESSKHDRLLLMDRKFRDITSSTPGCVREDIPVEYVRIIEPVIVTTETLHVTGDHFYASIVRPHVYSEANPNLTAAVDAVLEPIYSEKMAKLEQAKASAASCTRNMQTHTETAQMTAAYSNGGFLTITISYGYFHCNIGHNALTTESYVFDVASGALIGLPNLWDSANNPNAEAEFLNVLGDLMTASGKMKDLSGRASGVTPERLYKQAQTGKYVVWDLTPDGIYFMIDCLNMNLQLSSVLVPYESLEGILREEYLPAEIVGAADCSIEPFREELLEDDSVTVYENDPAICTLIVRGLATNFWIDDSHGGSQTNINGGCAQFYAFGLQNCAITLPEPTYANYGYTVMWQDSQGDHSANFAIP